MLKQAKYNNDLYVIEKIPYQITDDTDVDTIYVPMDSVEGYRELNPTLPIEGYSYSTIKVNREPYQDYLEVICTSESNAPLMAVLYAKGLAANENYMTLAEAKAVTNEQLDGLLNGNTTVESFNEFKYFTNVTKVGTSDDAEESKTTAPFRQCTSLKSITLPPTVNELGARAFDQTRNMEVINGLENVHIFGNACLQGTWGDNTKQIINTLRIEKLKGTYNCSNIFHGKDPYKHIIIEDKEITELHTGCFHGLENSLETLVIPNNITVLGDHYEDAHPMGIFTGCQHLRRLNSDIDGVMNICDGVTFIGYQAFYCGGSRNVPNRDIHTLNIPDSVEILDVNSFGAFRNLETINIGSGMLEMKSKCFINCGVDNEYITINIKAINPPTWDGVLRTDLFRVKIFVPAESVDLYKAADGWNKYADTIFPMNN